MAVADVEFSAVALVLNEVDDIFSLKGELSTVLFLRSLLYFRQDLANV